MGLGLRRNEQPDAGGGDEEGNGDEEERGQTAVDGNGEDDAHDEQDPADFGEAERHVRNHFADHDAERLNRGNGELVQGAAFAFAHDGESDEKDDHDLNQHGNQTGDEEVGRPRGGIEEHRGTGFDDGLAGVGQTLVFEQNERTEDVEGGAGDGGIGAIDEQLDGGSAAFENPVGVIGGDLQGDLSVALADFAVELIVGAYVAADGKRVGGAEAFDEFPAALGGHLIINDGGNLADIHVQREAEDDELDDGNQQGEDDGALVATEVKKLFLHHRNHAGERVHTVFRI